MLFRDRIVWSALVMAVWAAPCASQQTRPMVTDVLIIYSSGNPSGTISELKTDSVTTPTPVRENMRTLSEKLDSALRAKHLTVRAVRAEKVSAPTPILSARMVVIGSPSYFGNVSWEVKKLFDEQFGLIYGMPEKLNGVRTAVFSMAEIETSALETIDAVRRVVRDCAGVAGPSMIVLTPHSLEEVQKRVEKFADEIAANLK